MPYVIEEQRQMVDPNIDALAEAIADLISRYPNALKGIANYTITKLLLKVMKPSSGWNYAALCDLMGTFTCAQSEVYRRLVGPYEDKAIAKNGDLIELQV